MKMHVFRADVTRWMMVVLMMMLCGVPLWAGGPGQSTTRSEVSLSHRVAAREGARVVRYRLQRVGILRQARQLVPRQAVRLVRHSGLIYPLKVLVGTVVLLRRAAIGTLVVLMGDTDAPDETALVGVRS